MHVGPVQVERSGIDRIRLSAKMDEGELWFDIPEIAELPETLADSFMIMGLAASMLRNEPLIVADANKVSRVLVENLSSVQLILNSWNPRFKRISIIADCIEPSEPNDRVASMYSGGVDSIHALWQHRSRVTDAVFIGGFDFEMNEDEFTSTKARNQCLVNIFEKPLLTIHSNQQPWGAATGVARNFWHSGYLAAATLFFRFKEVLIPSAYTYAELNPTGCHPLLDPLWSNGTTNFLHVDSEFRRTEKLAYIASDSRVLENLHVCWKSPIENCGRCDKCIRTMVALDAMGLNGPFPRRTSLREISRLKATDWHGLSNLIDNVLLANDHGRYDLVGALKCAIRRYDRGKALEHFDRGVLRGLLRKIRLRVRPYTGRVGFTNGRPDADL